MECDGCGQCRRHSAGKHPDFPVRLRVNVGQWTITDGGAAGNPRKTDIKAVTRIDGRLLLHGGVCRPAARC